MGLIYIARNLKNNMCYVGQTTRTLEEWKLEHIYDSLVCKSKTYFHRTIRKYGEESCRWEHLGNYETKRELHIAESLFILFFKSHFCKNGYNLTWGGDGGDTLTNHPYIEEIKIKISKNITGNKNGFFGKHHTEKSKEKRKETLKNNNYVVSEETRNKLSESHKGKTAWNKGLKHTEETKNKMSASRKGMKSMLGKKHSEETKKKNKWK